MTDQEAIQRAQEIGMLAGQDLATARAQLVPGAHIDGAIRALVHVLIGDIVAAFDAHNAETYDGKVYRCPCKLRGTRVEWERHLADKLADALAGE